MERGCDRSIDRLCSSYPVVPSMPFHVVEEGTLSLHLFAEFLKSNEYFYNITMLSRGLLWWMVLLYDIEHIESHLSLFSIG